MVSLHSLASNRYLGHLFLNGLDAFCQLVNLCLLRLGLRLQVPGIRERTIVEIESKRTMERNVLVVFGRKKYAVLLARCREVLFEAFNLFVVLLHSEKMG